MTDTTMAPLEQPEAPTANSAPDNAPAQQADPATDFSGMATLFRAVGRPF